MKNILAENMLRFGSKNLTESEKQNLQRLIEADVTTISMPGQKEAGDYFSELVAQRRLSTKDTFQFDTVLYRIASYNEEQRLYLINCWGIVMKGHANFAKAAVQPSYFTAQGFTGDFSGVNGTEPGNPPAAAGNVRFGTSNQYTEGGWSTTNKHWTKIIQTTVDSKMVVPALNFNTANTWIGIDNFKKMVNNLPDKSKLLTNFCTNYAAHIAVVPEDQRDLYTCPTKKP